MKKNKLLMLIILIITLVLVGLNYFTAISIAKKGDEAFDYNYANGKNAPPSEITIHGKKRMVYCSQAGASLHTDWGTITFVEGDTKDLTPGQAYALSNCKNAEQRQNLIWMDKTLSNNTGIIDWKGEANDKKQAEKWHQKIEPFNKYYKELQKRGKTIKFENTNPKLQSSADGKFKIGPFKLDFYKSEFSGISNMQLETDDGKTIKVEKVSFNKYTGTVENIESGEEFYIVLSKDQVKNSTKVKLKADYHYTEASGKYTYYLHKGKIEDLTVQRLMTVDYKSGEGNSDTTGPEIILTIDLAGKVFKDNPATKGNDVDGIISTGDEMLKDIEVTLFDQSGKEVAKTTTDENGYYEFKDQPAITNYYVRFKYNGQLYEPTTYQRVSKVTDSNGSLEKTTIAERSYATDGKQNRQEFNNKFTPVDATHQVPSIKDREQAEKDPAFDIYAYTGPNGMQELIYYGIKSTEEERMNINFGIKDREQFDMNLRKDLVKVDASINGKTQTYNYPGGNEDLEVNIRGTDINSYNRVIRKEDLAYTGSNKLQLVVKYKIQIKNQSVGKITGYITDLNDFYDTSYQFIRSYDENEKEISWTQASDISGSGKSYHSMHTTALSGEGIDDKKVIYVEYKVTDEALQRLLNEKTSTKENFAEIAGYKNTYREARKDLNGQVISEAGENAGLIDIDSTPANMNPVSDKVQNFVNESKTESYQNLGGEEKTKKSQEVFEDDADYAPGLKLIVDADHPRTLTGTVFEDEALKEELKNNERIGNGQLDNNENKVKEVKVELICQNNKDVETITTRSDGNGGYKIEGFIPGDYAIKFTYGDYECLKAVQPSNKMYTGQDYKSTIYTQGNYTDAYWYDKNADNRANDATDEMARRETVNNYSKTLRNTNATVLNETKDDGTIKKLAEETTMYANTANMTMEIEYCGKVDTNNPAQASDYSVKNIDFGIIERPRSSILLKKDLANYKLTSSDGQTIFDSKEKATNLTWKKNEEKNNRITQGLVTGTIDENLIHGSTLELTFNISAKNTSEVDYNDEQYYKTGKVSDKSKIVTLKANKLVDYIPNNLSYDDNINKGNGWDLRTGDKITELTKGVDPELKPISDEEDTFKAIQSIVVANANNPIVKDDLIPANGTNGIGKKSESDKATIVLTKVLSSDGNDTADTSYENTTETTEIQTTNGRRLYNGDGNNKVVSIPGNYNENEPDLAKSEHVTIQPPFGAADAIKYIVIAIGIIAVFGLGVFVIKKKVLRK